MQGNTFLIAAMTVFLVGAAPPVRADETMAAEPNGIITLRDAMALALRAARNWASFPMICGQPMPACCRRACGPIRSLTSKSRTWAGSGERSGFDAAQTTVQVGQPIELGGKRAKRTHVASLDKELVQWDYQSARLDVMRETTRAFVATLAAQERLAWTERLLELSRQAQSAVAQRVKAGKDSPVEELRADVALSESRIERQKAEKALTAARHGLAAAWGGQAPAFAKVEGDFYETPEPPALAEMTAAVGDNPGLGPLADGGRPTAGGFAFGEGPGRAGYHRRRRACAATSRPTTRAGLRPDRAAAAVRPQPGRHSGSDGRTRQDPPAV